MSIQSRFVIICIAAVKIFSVSAAAFEGKPDQDGRISLPTDVNNIFQEYRLNYILTGKPNTKVQFSFKIQLHDIEKLFFAYTQTLFWETGQRSNPFSEANYNPEFFYQLSADDKSFLNFIMIGYGHLSNGKDAEASRSIDMIFFDFIGGDSLNRNVAIYYIIRLQFIFNEDEFNKEIRQYYGPLNLKIYFNRLAQKLFNSSELYLEYYNGGQYAEDVKRSSFRISLSGKPWKNSAKPKIFFQYFNGYAEKLGQFNTLEETYRIGISIGSP